jgi:hypothetical protein
VKQQVRFFFFSDISHYRTVFDGDGQGESVNILRRRGKNDTARDTLVCPGIPAILSAENILNSNLGRFFVR